MKRANIISFIVLLAVLGYVFYRGFSNTIDSVLTVIINDQGFSPEKVVVSSGTTITWINRGERRHWPASNFHPTHTLYPKPGGCLGSQLDACRGLVKGESYSFKFNIPGKWLMHDHLFPGLIMVVEVIDEGASLPGLPLIKGPKGGGPVAEFRNLDYDKQLDFIKSMSKDNPSQAWSYVKEAFMVKNQVVGNAHEFAHIVGNQAFEKFGLSGVKVCDQTFAFGCFHGVTEKMLLSQGLKVIKSIEEGCLKIFPPNKSQDYTGCIHGTGHGVYSFEGGNMKKALADCDIISEPYRQYCYDGVFMENSSAPENKIFDARNPWKFCADLNERYHRNCARYQSQIFLGEFGSINSVKVVGQNCALGPSVLLRETCFESLGYYISQQSLGKAADILKSCRQMPNIEGIEICTTGGAIESVFQKYAGFESTANKLCQSLTEPRQTMCLNNIKRMIK